MVLVKASRSAGLESVALRLIADRTGPAASTEATGSGTVGPEAIGSGTAGSLGQADL